MTETRDQSAPGRSRSRRTTCSTSTTASWTTTVVASASPASTMLSRPSAQEVEHHDGGQRATRGRDHGDTTAARQLQQETGQAAGKQQPEPEGHRVVVPRLVHEGRRPEQVGVDRDTLEARLQRGQRRLDALP